MPSPVFELFEDICDELSMRDSVVLPTDFLSDLRQDDLQAYLKQPSPDSAFRAAIRQIEKHFRMRQSIVPFSYDLRTREFRKTDTEYVAFISEAIEDRGLPARSRLFEVATCNRLTLRATGNLTRVGWPRTQKKKLNEYRRYLQTLGFNQNVAWGREKDGGFDVIWILPLGAVPHRPLFSFQCKNGSFDQQTADTATGTATRSLACHRGLIERIHTQCIVFNDYIEKDMLPRKPNNIVTLGLSDLARPRPFRTLIF